MDFSGNAITDFDEVATRLIHINELEPSIRKRIQGLHLKLDEAIKRCKAIHQECEGMYGTMAVKKCPDGYERVGCCKCT